jgi:hypothetical protein
MRMNLKEVNEIARVNHWDCNRHTLIILQGLLRDIKRISPGEIFALRRAIRIVRKAKR